MWPEHHKFESELITELDSLSRSDVHVWFKIVSNYFLFFVTIFPANEKHRCDIAVSAVHHSNGFKLSMIIPEVL